MNMEANRKPDRTQLLAQSPVFSALDEEELHHLSELVAERHFTQGEYVFWEGDAPKWFHIVVKGRVKVVKQSPSGKEIIIAVFNAGEVFGEVAVFGGKPYPASAQAMEDTAVLSINREEFLSFLAQNPGIALKIIVVLGERLRSAHERLRDLASEKVEQRVARILLMLYSKVGSVLPFTRQEIADMAGTTIETSIRTMSRLKNTGIIGSTRGQITILDEPRLRQLSQGNPPD